jgi:hypothetical protein
MKLFFYNYENNLEIISTHAINGWIENNHNGYCYQLLNVVMRHDVDNPLLPISDDCYRITHWIKVFSGEYP